MWLQLLSKSKSLTNIKMAKIPCVGRICSFIHYHLGNQGLQKKAARGSCDQRGTLRGNGSRGQAPAKDFKVNTDLSHPPRRFTTAEVSKKWGLLLNSWHSLKADWWHPSPATGKQHEYCRGTPHKSLGIGHVGEDTPKHAVLRDWFTRPPSSIQKEPMNRRAKANSLTPFFQSHTSKSTPEARDGYSPMKYLEPPTLELETLSNRPILGTQTVTVDPWTMSLWASGTIKGT